MSIFANLPGIFTSALGEPLGYTPPGGGYERDIVGLWEADYSALSGLAGVDIDQAGPAVHVNVDDVPYIDQGAIIRRGSENYLVRSVRPDGQGMVSLMLEIQGV